MQKKMYEYISNNEIDTKKIAYKLASKLKNGDIVILSGDLGSGKTKFVEGFLSFWNVENEISSPTFTIVNEYSKEDLKIYHFDVYRLENEDEFLELGGLEYFDKGISLIEWGEMIENIIPEEYIKISFSKNFDNINIRALQFEASSKRLGEIIKEII